MGVRVYMLVIWYSYLTCPVCIILPMCYIYLFTALPYTLHVHTYTYLFCERETSGYAYMCLNDLRTICHFTSILV